MKNSKGKIMKISLIKYWASDKYDNQIKAKVTAKNWINEYIIIYLNVWREVTKLAFPSLKSLTKQEISGIFEVKSNKYLGDTLNDMDKISVILKRLGETAVIEINEEPTEGQEQTDGKEE